MTSTVYPNITEPAKEVRHAELERFSEESGFRSKCPVCKDGILLVYRDQRTFVISEHDRCVSCGQLFRYLDVDDLRRIDGTPKA